MGRNYRKARDLDIRWETYRKLPSFYSYPGVCDIAPGEFVGWRATVVVHTAESKVVVAGIGTCGEPRGVEGIEGTPSRQERRCPMHGRAVSMERIGDTSLAPFHRVAIEIMHPLRRIRGPV